MMCVTVQEMVCWLYRNAMKGMVITLPYFFYLLLMAVQQAFLRAVACLPVELQHCIVHSYPCALLAHPYRVIYTEFKLHCAHYGKGLFVGCPAQYLISWKNRVSLQYKHGIKHRTKCEILT